MANIQDELRKAELEYSASLAKAAGYEAVVGKEKDERRAEARAMYSAIVAAGREPTPEESELLQNLQHGRTPTEELFYAQNKKSVELFKRVQDLRTLLSIEQGTLGRYTIKTSKNSTKTVAFSANFNADTIPEQYQGMISQNTLTNVKTAKTVDSGVKSNTYEGNVYLSDTTQQLNRETVKQVNYDHPETTASQQAAEIEKINTEKWGAKGSNLREYNEMIARAQTSNPTLVVKLKYAGMDKNDPKVKAAYDAEMSEARWEATKDFFTGLLPPIKANQGCATFPNCPSCSFLNSTVDLQGISDNASKIGNNLRDAASLSAFSGFTQGVLGALNCLQQVQKSKVATFIASAASASKNGNIKVIDTMLKSSNPLTSNNPIRGNVATAVVRMEQNPDNINAAFDTLNTVGVSKNDVFKTAVPPVAGAFTVEDVYRTYDISDNTINDPVGIYNLIYISDRPAADGDDADLVITPGGAGAIYRRKADYMKIDPLLFIDSLSLINFYVDYDNLVSNSELKTKYGLSDEQITDLINWRFPWVKTAVYDLDKYAKSINGGTSFITQSLGADKASQFVSIANLSANRNALTQRTVSAVDTNGRRHSTTTPVPLMLAATEKNAETTPADSVLAKATTLNVLPGDTALDVIPSGPNLNAVTTTNISPYREDVVYLI